MSILIQALLLAVYAAAATAAATFAPIVLPELGAAGPLVCGALTLAVLGTGHAVVGVAAARRAHAHEIEELRFAYDQVMYELSVARSEARQIHDAIVEAGRSGKKSNAMRAVVDEVKVLKGLIEQLAASRQASPEPALAARADAPAASPVPVENLDEAEALEVVRQGLEANRVDLYLQPVVRLPQRKREFFECYSRIRDAHGGVIRPEQYIHIAEREGLVTVIDNILLFRCVQLVRKTQRMERNVRFFYNMSPRTLADTTFFPEFLAFMSENPELATQLIFEFTQADIAELPPEAMHNLARLGERGFRFSLDQVSRLDMNFGELSRRHFRFVKVDAVPLMEHLRRLDDMGVIAEFQEELQRAAVDLIAEKIEDEHTLVEILDYRIDYGQGYLFGEPRLAREA